MDENIIGEIRKLVEEGLASAKDRWEHMRWSVVLAALDRLEQGPGPSEAEAAEAEATESDQVPVTESDGDGG